MHSFLNEPSLTRETIENAFRVSHFIADVVSGDATTLENKQAIITGTLAVALLIRFFDEDKAVMLELFSAILDACESIAPYAGE